MDIWNGSADVPSDLGETVVTIGVFDGLHKGHRALVDAAVADAARRGLPTVLMTFNPNPVALFAPDKVPPSLSTISRRAELAEAAGIDHMLVLAFDRAFAQVEASEFVKSILGDALHAQAVFVGDNFTYGAKASGTSETLPIHGAENGIDVSIVDLLNVDADGIDERVSSTRVRALLAEGAIAAANECLGYIFRVDGEVVRGQGRGGAQLGYPTANIDFDEGLALPADGVYAAWFTALPTDTRPEPDADGDIEFAVAYPAAVSVGSNVTFGDTQRTIEAFVLDHHADLYGVAGQVAFVDRIRGMEKFDGIDQLIERMDKDVVETRRILGIEQDNC